MSNDEETLIKKEWFFVRALTLVTALLVAVLGWFGALAYDAMQAVHANQIAIVRISEALENKVEHFAGVSESRGERLSDLEKDVRENRQSIVEANRNITLLRESVRRK